MRLRIAFQSTLLIRGATGKPYIHSIMYLISIHAPHTRSDLAPQNAPPVSPVISIHAPHTRSDGCHGLHGGNREISIHAPHTRSDVLPLCCSPRTLNISIHAPHTRSDVPNRTTHTLTYSISIHAPHTRSDDRLRHHKSPSRYFNPRSSYEERPQQPARISRDLQISIHAPHTRSDNSRPLNAELLKISIHAPHTRSDPAHWPT